uniref:Microfibril associated protein 2 n=1 Tax=Bubo bubo TaxID=30461 RepID=A0A8C0EGA9_BUBBB
MSGWGGGGFLGDACTVPLLTDVTPRAPEEQFRYQSQQQSQQEIVPAPTPGGWQPPAPSPPHQTSGSPSLPCTWLYCREEQYPCTRLYSVHKPCKQCLNEICFYSLRRVYVINKEICVRTVCAHEDPTMNLTLTVPNSTRSLSAGSTRLFNPSRDGDSPPALGSPFQRPTAPSAKKSFLRASLTLPWRSLRPFPLGLALVPWLKRLLPPLCTLLSGSCRGP